MIYTMQSRLELEWWEKTKSTFQLRWSCTRDKLLTFFYISNGRAEQSIQEEDSGRMLFTDGIALIDKTLERVWRQTPESKGFRFRRTKIVNLEHQFNVATDEANMKVKLATYTILRDKVISVLDPYFRKVGTSIIMSHIVLEMT